MNENNLSTKNNSIKTIIDVWFITYDGGVFIKSLPPKMELIDTEHFTLKSESLEEALIFCNNLLGYKVKEKDLEQIVDQESQVNGETVHELEYLISVDYEVAKSIVRNTKGCFVDYRNIDEMISSYIYQKSEHFNDVYYMLLQALDNRFGVKPAFR